ncbi:MAG: hypothetical protein IH991_21560, partial [Planctomycetes bacterium]|nr:hypothetical protein [Planctomycetota bacterium]
VVLISSISGGCGSGMVLDVAYMVRKVLGELGADKHRICGILAHSTPRNTDGKDLAIANAFACLSELQHYCRADHYYPGDPVCGLPPFTPDIAPFDDTYMVHLGDDLNEEQLQSASDWVAEYLYLDSVTAGKTVFQACRASQDSEDASSESTQLRTMGLTQIGCSNAETVTAATELLCQRVIHRWHKLDQITPDPSKTESAIRPTTEVPLDESNRVTSPMDSLCSQQCQQLGLDFDVLVQSTQQIVDGQLGEDLQDWLQQLLAPFANDKSADSSAVAALEAIDAKLGLRAAGQEQTGSSTSDFEEGLTRLLNERAETLGKAICDWLWTLLDEPELRLIGVKSAVEWLTTHFASLSDKAQEVFDRHSRELHEISKSLDNGKRKQQPEDDRQLVMQYFQLGMTRTAIEQLERISKPIEARIKALDGQLAELGRELNYAANHFSHIAADYQPLDDQSTSLQQTLWQAMQAQLPELAVKLDRDFSEQFFGPHGGLRSLVDSDQNLRELLPQTLRHAARQALADARQHLRIVDALAAQGDASEARAQLGKCLEAATPKLLECGGSKRLVVVAPQHALSGGLRQWLQEGFDESLSVVPDSDSDIVFCFEVGNVSLAQVAATLIDDRLDYAEAASRLHSRNDVQWLPW